MKKKGGTFFFRRINRRILRTSSIADDFRTNNFEKKLDFSPATYPTIGTSRYVRAKIEENMQF